MSEKFSDENMEVPVDFIVTGRFNPRRTFDREYIKELAGSIRRDGQWNPVILRQRSDDKYDIIAGECRLRAVKKLGLMRIKARVLNVDDEEANLLALKTNLMRRDMNPVEEGHGIKRLIDMGWSLNKVAKELNKSQTWILFRLKLVENASEGLQNAVLNDGIRLLSAVKIAELPEGLQGPVASKTIRERLNFKEVERLVDLLKLTHNNSDLELLLGTPFKEFVNLSSSEARVKIESSRKNKNVTVVDCECGIRYVVDWVNRCIVSEEAFVNERE